jgi:hypothetical protein
MRIRSSLVFLLATLLAATGIAPASADTTIISLNPVNGTQFKTVAGASFPLKVSWPSNVNAADLKVLVTDPSGGLMSGTAGAQVLQPNGISQSSTQNGATSTFRLPMATGTPHPGGLITSNTTFSLAGSPYKFARGLEIRAGVTVTVEAGVTLDFSNASSMFWVHGSLLLVGTESQRIKVATPSYLEGGMVNFSQATNAIVDFNYVDVFGSRSGGIYQGGSTSSLKIRNSEIYDLPSSSWGELSILEITDSALTRVGQLGRWWYSPSTLTIERNLIDHQLPSPFLRIGNSGGAEISIVNNTFLNVGEYFVEANVNINLANNYWPNLTQAEIQGAVRDKNDSLAFNGTAITEPSLLNSFISRTSASYLQSAANADGYHQRSEVPLVLLTSRANNADGFTVTVQVFSDTNSDGYPDAGEHSSAVRLIEFVMPTSSSPRVEMFRAEAGQTRLEASVSFDSSLNIENSGGDLFSVKFAHSNSSVIMPEPTAPDWKDNSTLWFQAQSAPLTEGLIRAELYAAGQLLAFSSQWPVLLKQATSISFSGAYSFQPGSTLVLTGTLRDMIGNPISLTDSDIGVLSVELSGPGLFLWNSDDPRYANEDGEFVVVALLGANDSGYGRIIVSYDPDGAGPRAGFSVEREYEVTSDSSTVNGGTLFNISALDPLTNQLAAVPSARVWLESDDGGYRGYSVTTDQAGRALFPQLESGDYRLTIQGPTGSRDYATTRTEIYLDAGGQVLKYVLDRRIQGSLSLEGRVVDLSGVGIADAQVNLYSNFDDFFQSVSSDSSGYYEFTGLNSGEVSLSAQREGYESGVGASYFTLETSTSREITLWQLGTDSISGFVSDSVTNQPLAGVSVSYFASDPSIGYFSGDAISDQAGRYAIPLPQGVTNFKVSLNVWQNSSGYFSYSQNVTVSSGSIVQNILLENALTGTSTIRGKFVDRQTGEGISDARVSLYFDKQRANGSLDSVSISADTDEFGNYEFLNLPVSSSMSINASRSQEGAEGSLFDFSGDPRNLAIYQPNTIREIQIEGNRAQQLDGSGVISGQIVNDAGNPVGGVRVHAELASLNGGGEPRYGLSRSAVSDGNGDFTLDRLTAGTYELSASEDGFDMPNWNFGPAQFESDYVLVPTALSSVSIPNIVMPRLPIGNSSVRVQVWNSLSDSAQVGVSACLRNLDIYSAQICENSDSQGWVDFEMLAAGRYEFEIFRQYNLRTPNREVFGLGTNSSRLLGRVIVTPLDGASTESSLRVLVRDSITHEPVADANVSLSDTNSSLHYTDVKTGSDGYAVFANMQAGTYYMYAYSEGQYAFPVNEQNKLVTVETGPNLATLSLRVVGATGQVSGFVRDSFGDPVEGAIVNMSFTVYYDCCSGEGFGNAAVSDETGFYRIANVPVGIEVSESVTPPGMGSSRNFLAPLNGVTTISPDAPSVQKDFVLQEQGEISGSLTYGGKVISGANIVAIDRATGKEVESTFTRAGNWTLRNLAPGSYSIAVRPSASNGAVTIASGFIDKVSTSSSVIVYDYANAEIFTVIGSAKVLVPPVTALQGAKLTANVEFVAGSSRLSNTYRSAEVEVYRKNTAGNFVLFSALGKLRSQSFSIPNLEMLGLPAGDYKFKFVHDGFGSGDFLPVFHDGSSTLNSASVIPLVAGDRLELNPVNLVLRAPIEPSSFSLSGVDAREKALKQGSIQVVETNATATISVGTQFAGEFVAVSYEGFVAASSFATMSTLNTWALVGQNGKVVLPKKTATSVAVSDSSGRLVGWVALSVPASNPSAGGGGGGGGGGAAASAPIQLSRTFFTGTVTPGQVLTGDVGSWEKSENLIYRYQWHRCSKELDNPNAPTVQLNCSAIFGAESLSYTVTDSERDKFLLLEVIARDKTGTLIGLASGFSDTVQFGKTGSKPSIVLTPANPEEHKTWAKRMVGNTEAKLYAKNIIGKGKVSFRVNGKEIAWVRALDASDSKLRLITEGPMAGSNYLVRTVNLVRGQKNVLEVYVDGVRTTRTAYSY